MRGQRDVKETSRTRGARAGAPGASGASSLVEENPRRTARSEFRATGPAAAARRPSERRARGSDGGKAHRGTNRHRRPASRVASSSPARAIPIARVARARWKRRDLCEARNRAQTRDARREASPRPPTAREEEPREVRARTMLASGNCVRRCAFQRGRECRGGTPFTHRANAKVFLI